MEDYLDKHIRVSTRTKYRLDELKKDMSYNAYITEMLDYFEVTCSSPKIKTKNPTAKLEKRIEACRSLYEAHRGCNNQKGRNRQGKP